MSIRSFVAWALAAAVGGLLPLSPAAGQDNTPPDGDVAAGERQFQLCSQCHGNRGEGNPAVEAPGIAGLPGWYVKAQLYKFRDGVRGAHPDDISGMRMRPMARHLTTDQNIEDVAAYVATLPAVDGVATLEGGDPERGKQLYAPCTACHGPDGSGNPALFAPPVKYHDDWYIVKQLQKFKAGIRGTNPDDKSGALMRPMSMTLVDEQAMKDVAAYILTLGE